MLMEQWKVIFEFNEVKQKLGINFVRSLKSTLPIRLLDTEISLIQNDKEEGGLSGVVWDAGLLLIDFFLTYSVTKPSSEYSLGVTLDVGTGTGVCGIAALMLGASSVCFTDIKLTNTLCQNINNLPIQYFSSAELIEYDWNSNLHTKMNDIFFDTIICSDILYDPEIHCSLISFLKNLKFKKIVFSHKRRNNANEIKFFEKMETFCDLEVVKSESITLTNLPSQLYYDIFIIIATLKIS
jgi:predicted nicotinamide N-methyase